MAQRAAPQPPDHKLRQATLLKQEVRDRYDERNSLITEMRSRRFQEKRVTIPEAFKVTAREVRLPILNDTIELMTAVVSDAPWRVHVDPYDVGPTAQRNSSLRERWSEAAVEQIQRDLGRNVLGAVTANQMGDGVGVVKVLYRPDSWRDLRGLDRRMFGKPASEMTPEENDKGKKERERAKRGMPLPFTILDVDPLSYYPILGPFGEVQAVIEVAERPIQAVAAQYADRVRVVRGPGGWDIQLIESLGEAYPPRDTDRTPDQRSTIEVWEYWDLEDTITFIGNTPIKYARHGMGEVPYFHCAVRQAASRDPVREQRPTGHKQVWLLDLLDSLWTMAANVAYLNSFPTPVTYTPPQVENIPMGANGRPDSVQFEVGRHMVLYQGQEIRWLAPPSEHLEMMGNLIQQATHLYEASTGLGPSIRGMGGADQAGYAINQLIQASMLALNPAIQSRDWMLSRMVCYIWRLIEKRVKEPVWVWGADPDPEVKARKWLGLGPKDIAGYYRCEVTTKPLVDQMRIARGQFAAGMVQAKLMDRETAIEDFLMYPAPEEIIDKMWVDEALESGPLKDQAITTALKRAGLLDTPQQQAPGPMPGMPESPFGPGPGSLPGMPPAGPPTGPGQGMPLLPPTPEAPGPTEAQLQAAGGLAMPGGRAAGAGQQPPMQTPGVLMPERPR